MKKYLAIFMVFFMAWSAQSRAADRYPPDGKYSDMIREILREPNEDRKIAKLSAFMDRIHAEFMKPPKDGEEKKTGSAFFIRMVDKEGFEINWATKHFDPSKVGGIFIGPGGRWIRFPAFFLKDPPVNLVRNAIHE